MKTNLQIVTEHYAASARQEIAAMMADVSPDVAWTEMAGFPCAGTWIGPDQIITNVFAMLGSEWENYNFSLEQIIDAGEQLVAHSGHRRVKRESSSGWSVARRIRLK